MRLDFSKVDAKTIINIDENSSTLKKYNHSSVIEEINSVTGTVTTERADEVIIVKYNLKANLLVHSSISGDLFDYIMNVNETLYYTSNKALESEDIFFEDKDYIDLNEDIYSLIVTNLPIKLHKKGEKYPSGDNYRVLTEDELNEDSGDQTSPFDVLKDLDL